MKFCSKKNLRSDNSVGCVKSQSPDAGSHILYAESGFSLVEAVTALIILALISSSVMVVINRCMTSAADSSLRMQAFEVARENMEALLSKDSVQESVEYGNSDKYPEIKWETVVQTFYEPLMERIWVRGICSAEYTDTSGDVQKIELMQWLTGLTRKQLIQMIEQKQKEWSADEIIKTAEDAADYVDVDVEIIQQWVDNGMPLTGDDFYITAWLDLYSETDGEPTAQEKEFLLKEYMSSKGTEGEQKDNDLDVETEKGESEQENPEEQKTETEEPESEPEYNDNLLCGEPRSVVMAMPLGELYEFLMNCD